MLETIVALILSSAAPSEEPALERTARLRRAADAIHIAARGDREMVAALLELGRRESTWHHYVYANECAGKTNDCDAGQSRSYWQLSQRICPALWGDGDEYDAANCAAKHLRYTRSLCRGSWAGAFGVYAGAKCSWGGGREREAGMRRLLRRL